MSDGNGGNGDGRVGVQGTVEIPEIRITCGCGNSKGLMALDVRNKVWEWTCAFCQRKLLLRVQIRWTR